MVLDFRSRQEKEPASWNNQWIYRGKRSGFAEDMTRLWSIHHVHGKSTRLWAFWQGYLTPKFSQFPWDISLCPSWLIQLQVAQSWLIQAVKIRNWLSQLQELPAGRSGSWDELWQQLERQGEVTTTLHFRDFRATPYVFRLVVTGTWMDYDFPETVGNETSSQLTSFPSFFRGGRAKNHQPVMIIEL